MKECPACKRCFSDEINHCPQDGEATLPSLFGEPILDARYQLERRLGQGGMGVVFHARHIFLKTQHAIKVILPDLVGNDPMLVTRFRQEALAAAAIRHPNIIAVTDFGVVRGTMPFLVMEFVNGRSLQEIMAEEGAMSPARAFELIVPTAAGIAAAHRQNIVHRDLKPLNIMIQEHLPINEGLKILDFGLAKIKSGELLGSFVQAKTTGLMGSPFYMAPEQWSDEEPDARADIYSLGVILYQMLAGDVPFRGSSIPAIMKKHLTQTPPTMQSMGRDVPPQIEAVVRHALEKDAAARTPSAEALLIELKEAFDSLSGAFRSPYDTVAGTSSKTAALSNNSNSTTPTNPSGYETKFDPQAGTISAIALDPEQLQAQLAANEEARREHEEKTRFAREQIALDAEERSRTDREAARKRAEEEEKGRKEREERDEKERLQQEQLERVARQAEELEEKFARLTTNTPLRGTAVVDLAGTLINTAAPATGDYSPGSQAATLTGDQGVLPGDADKRKKPGVLVFGGLILLVLLAGGGVGGYFMFFRQKAPVEIGGGKDGTGGKGVTPPVPIKAELIPIPGGTFQMGRVGATVAEIPVHAVTVKPFDIDKTEVTNAEYAQFVNATQHPTPSNWAGSKPLPGDELLPVTFVSYDDATAFADWRSKRDGVQYRLPTEEEWEYAARGGDQDNIYPWGNDWVEGNAIVMNATTKPKPVGSAPKDKTRWGVMDMLGNVYEWTSTKGTYYPGSPGKVEGEQLSHYVIRGASYATDQRLKPISATRRDWFSGTTTVAVLGFRLVRPR